jgi:DNA-binding transcriptional ArsR family regulator
MTDPSPAFHALSDPTRRKLLETLMTRGSAPVTELTAAAGVTQPSVSKHLMILREAGLVTCKTAGRQNFYSASPDALAPLFDWLSTYRRFWMDRLDRLEDTLDRLDQ